MSLEEVQSRKLDVAVKNNKMFYTRERKDIGMVGNATCDSLCLFKGCLQLKRSLLLDSVVGEINTSSTFASLAHYGSMFSSSAPVHR